jgi:hypothetical protein
MISGMFRAGLKPRLKFANMGQRLNELTATEQRQTSPYYARLNSSASCRSRKRRSGGEHGQARAR